MDSPLTRRLVTIPAVFAAFIATTALLPLLVLVAIAVDIVLGLARGRPWVTWRLVLFAWVYLLGEVWAVVALAAVGLLPGGQGLEPTYRLQEVWAGWNLRTIKALFRLEFHVETDDVVTPGPIVLLARHASLIDSLLPAELVTKRHGLRLRYVLKKELLVDPALDIAGNRLPNVFVDRESTDSARERDAVRDLVRDLGQDEGVLIFPEGTRYSEAKRVRYVRRIQAGEGRIGELAGGLRKVLPPRPGGTLTLLDATTADVVVMAHRGLEGFATVRDMLGGDLVGRAVTAAFWRIPRESIPAERSERVEWLFEQWAAVDDWVVEGVRPGLAGT
jgi:1-acyl-sn-glycerol-3-phosphate acyltransferase